MERYTEGRSSAFFYFSTDGRFLVKTLTRGECQLLIRFLPSYVRHMSSNPHSLLCRFVGLHSIRMYSLTLRFCVMQSVFLTPLSINERYDIKGSTVDRYTGREGRKEGKVSSSSGGDGLALTYSEVRMDESYPHGRAHMHLYAQLAIEPSVDGIVVRDIAH